MNNNDKTTHINEILEPYTVTTNQTFKAKAAMLFSAATSIVGFYYLMGDAAIIPLVVFFIVLLIADFIKRHGLSNYLFSLIKSDIIDNSKPRNVFLIGAIIAVIMTSLFDVIGSWAFADLTTSKYSNDKGRDSIAYELARDNMKSSSDSVAIYNEQLHTYNLALQKAKSECDSAWRMPKYKTKNGICYEQKTSSLVKPTKDIITTNKVDVSKVTSEIAISNNDDMITKYGKWVLFAVMILVTGLLQYAVIIAIIEDYNNLRDTLNDDEIDSIRDSIEEVEQAKRESNEKYRQMVIEAKKEQFELDNDFKLGQELMSIAKKQKRNKSRENTASRMREGADEVTKFSDGFLGTKPTKKKETPKQTKKVNKVKSDELEMSELQINLIKRLFKPVNHIGDKLTSKSSIIDTFPKNKQYGIAKELSGVYSMLLGIKAVERVEAGRNGGYFALALQKDFLKD